MVSYKKFNKEAMLLSIKDHPKNLKVVFEHTACDDFINFYKKFSVIKEIGMCYDTAHLHGSGFDISKIKDYKKPDIIHLNGN